MKIGLFDSGVGGLNVLAEFIKKYPNNTYYYYGDTKNVPYGDKDKETLLELSTKIISFFEDKKVDLIIIACGTVSSNCYIDLRKITNIPIYDIISPTIEFINSLNCNNVLVFGTKRTIESHVFKNNLSKRVKEVATSEFVPMIESYSIDDLVIKKYLDNENPDILVLGCTHYPILIDRFKKYLSDNTIIVDMGKVLAEKLVLINDSKQEIILYFSKIDDSIKKNIDNILPCSYSLYEDL